MTKPRARDLGIPLEGQPGEYNAITDVPGVTVGYATVIEGESARTGVTIIHPAAGRTTILSLQPGSPSTGTGK